jgi:CheY-like chemotaxis protein
VFAEKQDITKEIQACYDAGMNEYLAKPIDKKALLSL